MSEHFHTGSQSSIEVIYSKCKLRYTILFSSPNDRIYSAFLEASNNTRMDELLIQSFQHYIKPYQCCSNYKRMSVMYFNLCIKLLANKRLPLTTAALCEVYPTYKKTSVHVVTDQWAHPRPRHEACVIMALSHLLAITMALPLRPKMYRSVGKSAVWSLRTSQGRKRVPISYLKRRTSMLL